MTEYIINVYAVRGIQNNGYLKDSNLLQEVSVLLLEEEISRISEEVEGDLADFLEPDDLSDLPLNTPAEDLCRKNHVSSPKKQKQVKEQYDDILDFNPEKEKLSFREVKILSESILDLAEMLCPKKFKWQQRESGFRLIQSLLLEDCAVLTLLFARQSGKTEMVACILDALCIILPLLGKKLPKTNLEKFSLGLLVGIFAPANKQAKIMWGRAVARASSEKAWEIYKDLGRDPEVKSEEDYRGLRKLAFPNGSEVMRLSGHKSANLPGFTFHLIIYDEAQDIDDEVEEQVDPMGSATGATVIKLGTPGNQKNHFYKTIETNKNEMRRGKHRDHFEYDWNSFAKEDPRYRKFVMSRRKKFGEDSLLFRRAYKIEWVFDDSMFFTEDQVKALGGDFGLITYDQYNHYVIGIDVGKKVNNTVVTVCQFDPNQPIVLPDGVYYHKKIVNWLEMAGVDYEDQATRIAEFLNNYKNIHRIVFDCTGVGEAAYEIFRPKIPMRIPIDKFLFVPLKNKSDGYNHLRQEVLAQRISFPYSYKAQNNRMVKQFIEQMSFLLEKVGANGLIQVDGLEDEDDYPDSAVLCCQALIPKKTERSSVTASPNAFYRPKRNISRQSASFADTLSFKTKKKLTLVCSPSFRRPKQKAV